MSFPVELYLYDISHGMAKSMSMAFLGQQVDGIWHTGIVCYGYEYYYGGGIQAALPGQTMAGRPQQIIPLGTTSIDQATFQDWLRGVNSRFTPSTYSLLTHNCNHFTSACSQFLLNTDIPSFIIGQPTEIMSSPGGAMWRPMIENMEAQARGSAMFPGSWQEGETLSLPPINSKSSSAPAVIHFTTPASSSTPAPATTATVNTASVHAHPHDSLKLSISSSAKPLLSRDTKALSFLTLIKQASKKLDASLRLSEGDVMVLTEATATLQPQQEKAQLSPAAAALFERMVGSWPPSALLGVLGLFRLFLLSASVLEFYHKPSSAIDRLFTLVPSADLETKTEISEAVQVMALCSVSNLFAFPPLAVSLSEREEMYDMAFRGLSSPKQAVRLMAATVLHNAAVTRPFHADSDSAAESVSMLAVAIQEESDVDACSRMMLALAYNLYQNRTRVQILQAVGLDLEGVQVRFRTQVDKQSGAKVLTLCQDIVKIVDFEKQQDDIEQAD